MHLPDSILSALHAPFLLDGAAMQGFMLQVVQVLTGKVKAEDLTAATQARGRAPFSAFTPHTALSTQGYQSLDEVPAGSIAVHTVSGVMLPDDSWFGAGTRSLSQAIAAADAHPNIVAHVGVFNTPGGSTQALEDFATSIAATNKPFVGFAQQACSAGLWSICGADSIVLAGRTAMMGSIGTKAEFLDFSGMFEQMGIKQISVLASKSVNKNRSFDEAKAGNPKPLQAEILDPLNEVFLDTVLECRGDKIPAKQQGEVLSGLVFVGQACLDKGLADSMGSFDDALQLAQQLAGTSTASSSTSSKMGIFGNKTALPAALLALVGAESVTAEQVTAANAELKAGGITGATLLPEAAHQELVAKAGDRDKAEEARVEAVGKLTAITEALTTAGATDVAALAKDRDEWKGKAEAFGSQPGALASSAGTGKQGTEVQEPTAASTAQKAIDGLAHNAALDNHPLFGGK